MNLGLTSLLDIFLKRRSLAPIKRRPSRPRRRLLGERLETRYALDGDVSSPEPLPPDGSLEPTAPAEIAPPPDNSGSEYASPNPNTSNPTPPGQNNSAPIISGFTFSRDGIWITVQGLVSDDQSPVGYVVDIWGVLSTQTTVGADNHFSWRFQIPQEYSGTVYARTRDLFGLLSNTASINI